MQTLAASAATALTASPWLTAQAQGSAATGEDLEPQAAQRASSYPQRPLRFIVPYPAGGPLDQAARAISQGLRAQLGQPVIVENHAGAGGNIGADIVAKAPPDGYAIVMGAVATHAINPYLYRRMPYDASRDFAPVVRVAVVPNVLVMNPNTAQRLGIDSVRTLIAYARNHPGQLNFASGGNGSAGHLAGELFKTQAGISMVHIPYAGAGPAQLGLIAGQTDLMFDNLASAAGQIRSGRLRAYAVTTQSRSRQFPDLPTVAEAGLPGFDIDTWFGVMAPARTPPAIVDKLYRSIAGTLQEAEVRRIFDTMAADAAPLDPAAFTRFIADEQRRYQRIVAQSKAQID